LVGVCVIVILIVKLTTFIVVKGAFLNNQELIGELVRVGLSENQARIYALLVDNKELRIQEITSLSGLPRSSVYECLRRLFEFGIAEEVVGESYKTIRPYSIGAMHHGLDEEALRVQRVKRDLQALQQKLTITPPNQTVDKTSVRYYKDRSGARQLYWNTLKANNHVYVFSDWGRGRYVGMRFYERFVEESRVRGIQEQVLINPTNYALESIRQFTYQNSPISRTPIDSIRVLDKSVVDIQGDTLIYNQTYATVYLKNVKITGFEIESQHFVDTQRSIFETLWEAAKPITDFVVPRV
jgi:sugar-specific transcriptional regulator TrmB